jgi:methylphosphotriester-DNA--protein-cysteine methyltransferase
LQATETPLLQLPNPTGARARRVTAALQADPSDRRTLDQICKMVGAGKRTVERLFRDEVGMTPGKWRQQLRLMEAMRLLAEGAKVTHAARRQVTVRRVRSLPMFGKTLGTSPAAYFRAGTTMGTRGKRE